MIIQKNPSVFLYVFYKNIMSYSSITYVMIKEEYRKYLFYFCNIKLYITLKDNHSAHSPFIEEQERFYEIIENDILGAALNNA